MVRAARDFLKDFDVLAPENPKILKTYENFGKKKVNKNLKAIYKNLISKKNDNNDLISSFTKSYSYSFDKELLKKYSASKLDKIFPSFIDKALKEKKDLLDIVNSYLGKNLNINKDTFFYNYTKSNNDLVKSIKKKFSHIL